MEIALHAKLAVMRLNSAIFSPIDSLFSMIRAKSIGEQSKEARVGSNVIWSVNEMITTSGNKRAEYKEHSNPEGKKTHKERRKQWIEITM